MIDDMSRYEIEMDKMLDWYEENTDEGLNHPDVDRKEARIMSRYADTLTYMRREF